MTEFVLKTSVDEFRIPEKRVNTLSGTGQSHGLTRDLTLLLEGQDVADLLDVVDRPPAIVRDGNPDAADTARDTARGAQTVLIASPDSIETESGVFGVDSWTLEQDGKRSGEQQYRVTLQLVGLRALFTFSSVQFSLLPRSSAGISFDAIRQSPFILSPRSFELGLVLPTQASSFLFAPRIARRETYGNNYGQLYGAKRRFTLLVSDDAAVTYLLFPRAVQITYGENYGNGYGGANHTLTKS